MKSDYEKTLRWVNKERRKLGDPPIEDLLVGVQGSVTHCPLAHSIGHKSKVDYGCVFRYIGYEHGATHRMTRLPRYARRFARDFDRGRYAHLRMSRDELKPLLRDFPELALVQRV